MSGTEVETMEPKPIFIEKITDKTKSPGCIDGRPDPESEQDGFQMLGGSLHPLVLEAIITGKDFDDTLVEDGLRRLRLAGFGIGVHRGEHSDEEKSDCGFGDRLAEIIDTAKNNRIEILRRLTEIYEANEFPTDSLSSSYGLLSKYSTGEKIKIKGEKLIGLSEKDKANVENLRGSHQESVAFVNIKPNTTLDRKELNRQNKQAFNLDLRPAMDQTTALIPDADPKTIRDLSLILFQATEMVLVEQKGKPAVPVILHV